MQHHEGTFQGTQNRQLYHQSWLPNGEIKAVIIVMHGLGEHSGRYGNLVQHLVPLGYALYAYDHIGHGRSEGEREVIEDFSDLTGNVTLYTQMVKEWHPEKRLFILGHSMGGLIVSSFLVEHQHDFDGAILSAPAVKVSDSISKLTILVGQFLSKVAPRMGIIGVDATLISRDREVVEAYRSDPWVFHGKTPARLAAELLKAMQLLVSQMEKITLPLIILQGSDDQIIDPSGAQMLYENVRSDEKRLKIYEGFYHELFNEPEHALVLSDVEEWLKGQIVSQD